MAEDSTNTAAGLSADSDATIPRIKLSETGFTGLAVSNKQILAEAQRQFQFPAFFKVRQEMINDSTVASAFNVYKTLISQVKWTVEPPIGATDQQIARAKFVQQCMTDMETSWGSVINEIITYLEYGHSVQEKVFRRRLRKNGSRYNDGLVGIRKLAPRAQETIRFWYFSEDGRELQSIGQSTINLTDGVRYMNLLPQMNIDGVIEIPREKFLLFTADSTKNNPQGHSLLKPIYLAYKRMQLLQEQELLGVAKDAAGLPVVRIPPQYMSADASPDQKAMYQTCINIVNNLAEGTQRGMVFPTMGDPDTKQDMFDIKLLDRKGNSQFDVNEIIKRYQSDILCALSVDVIKMGQPDSSSSFALADTKSNMLTLALKHRLNEIAEVLNTDLVPQLFAMNGWLDEELPKFTPGDIVETDMETFSKYVQRCAATNTLELDRPLLNRIRAVGKIPLRPDDSPVDYENLTGNTSRSGDGMAAGGLDGTSTTAFGKDDRSASNADNKA